MNVKIGAVIKRLRTENKITQDTLATAIGVTPQAISRWESEGGYPDIELLPALADFFSVSTDKLIYPEPGKDFHELREHTECYHSLMRLKNKRYDGIRRDPRFVAVTEKLNEYAR